MILCVGLSPTVQRTLFFSRLMLGEVNRAHEILITASGKAVNVARVIHLLGGRSHIIQTIGGESGRFISQSLDGLGVAHTSLTVADDAPTRTCITLLTEGHSPTELVEEVRPVTAQDVESVRRAVRERLPHARALCLSGSFPPGVPTEFYADLVREANALGIAAIVDAQKGPLREALVARPFLVKPNLEEAAVTLGQPLTGDDDADARVAVAGLRAAGATWALVSQGRRGSLLGGPEGLWRIEPPRVETVNPIGSGDSLTAGLLFAYVEQGQALPEAAVYGTACGAANTLTPTSGVVRPEDVRTLLPQVRLTRLPDRPG